MADAPEKPQRQIRYKDDPSIRETFADVILSASFDGSAVRLVLAASRGEVAAEKPETGHLITAARLILNPQAAANLHAQLGQLLSALEQKALAKKVTKAPSPDAQAQPTEETSSQPRDPDEIVVIDQPDATQDNKAKATPRRPVN